MSAAESAYPSLLQGVSQQIPRLRLPGQVQVQENMLSDPVTGLRRRPGAKLIRGVYPSSAPATRLRVFRTDIGVREVQGVIDTVEGRIRLFDVDASYTELYTITSTYLQAPDASYIQLATVGEELFICNTSVEPSASGVSTGLSAANRGWAYIKAGAFSKTYELRVQTNLGAYTALYTTPNGTSAGDAALSTPDYIATQLANAVAGQAGALGITVTREGVYIYLAPTTAASCVTSSSSGQTYIEVSGSGIVRTEAQLPARLVAAANGYIMGVGDTGTLRYYKYDHNALSWLESGSFGSPATLVNMPVSVTFNSVFALNSGGWEGRLAGDDISNPNPEFITNDRITGMSSYQGRLVLLSGPDVSLSAAGKPRRFYRSTVVTLNDDDVINIRGSAGSAASYVRAVPFQKDLLLFSSAHQALIPNPGTALTPRNAQVVLTSQHSCDTSCNPVPIGRTMLFPMARSANFFGVMEMLQSPYTDSQYTSTDSTVHLPKYMPGKCRNGVSSSSSNMVLFTSSGDLKALFVYEYNWSGDEKIQQAWHKWTFPYDIAGAYFLRDRVVVVMVCPNGYIHTELDVRLGSLDADAQRLPLLDCWKYRTVTAGVGDFAMMPLLDPNYRLKADVVRTTSAMAGERVGFTSNPDNTYNTVRSFQDGQVAVGIPYSSIFSPTPVVLRDQNDMRLDAAKSTVLRYGVSLRNSGPFDILVSDAYGSSEGAQAPLLFSSTELDAGRGQLADESRIVVPARVNTNTGNIVFIQDGPWEMNIVGIDYVVRYNQRIRRR